MSAPHDLRVQRSRARGARLPADAVYVGRGSRWGNPFRVVRDGALAGTPLYRVSTPDDFVARAFLGGQHERAHAHQQAVDLFALHIGPMGNYEYDREDLDALRALAGRPFACWCPLDLPCHADVLLTIANQKETNAA